MHNKDNFFHAVIVPNKLINDWMIDAESFDGIIFLFQQTSQYPRFLHGIYLLIIPSAVFE